VADWLFLGISLAAGVGSAVVHFTGLWATVRRIPRSSRPTFLLLGSSIARTVFTLTVFFVVATIDLRQLPFCLVAFLLTRLVVLGLLGRQVSPALAEGRPYATDS
jgi:F1F0 ATPase subunit 2